MAAPRPLAGRYGFSKRIRGTQRTIIWLARSPGSGEVVVASVLPQARAAALAPLVGLEHPHLAKVLEILDAPGEGELPDDEPVTPDTRVAVAEYVEGRSLQQRVDAGPVSEETAVEWTIATADALSALHRAGGAHGAVSPRALLVVRPDGKSVPVLTHLLVPPSGAYCSPERVTGGGPSESDDTWALAATLYTALARKAPFHGGSRTELARAIVEGDPPAIADVDGDLMALILRGLTRDASRRITHAVELRDALDEWVELTGRRSVGDFAPVASLVGPSEPPPNVGDLSLIAALASPDSPESTAPLTIDPALIRELPPVDEDQPPPLLPVPAADPSEPMEAEQARAPAAASAPTPMGLSSAAAPPRAEPRPRRSPLALGAAVTAAAVLAALGGLWAGKARQERLAAATATAASTVTPALSTPVPAAANPSAPPVDTDDLSFEPVAEATPSAASPPGPPATTASAAAAPPAEASAATIASPTAPPGDVNACVSATLPEGTVGTSPELGYLCTDTELWGVARRLNLHIAKKGRGPGMVAWAYIGRFDLAAIALLRHRCCPGAEPLTAATPKGPCSTLTDSIRAVGASPTPANIDAYAKSVDCVVARGIRYPTEWWDRVSAPDARKHFEKLLLTLRPPP